MPENDQNSVLDREQAMRQLLHHLFIILAALIVFCFACVAWFVNNTRVSGQAIQISAAGKPEFALATVGTKEQGVYDSMFGLSQASTQETINEITYHIASSNSSFRLKSDKNLNNYLANADLRPGNRGSFDLYVICYTDKRELVLQPILSAWYEHKTESKDIEYKGAFSEGNDNMRTAAEFLKGHILLFANMDEKGMYSGNIDFTKEISVNLSTKKAYQNTIVDTENEAAPDLFDWGEVVYSEENTTTAVYRLPVYWVWPEQFGNFIYTGNSYNKNLFTDKNSRDYTYFVSAMESNTDYKKFFSVDEEVSRPPICTITFPENYQIATANYELYSGWYNAADEIIGDNISYIELGFELANNG